MNCVHTHLACKEGHGGAVDPGVVASSCHALQVVLTFRRTDAGTSQLAIIYDNVVTLHRFLHGYQRI